MIITDPIHGDIRTAMNMKKAIESVNRLPRIGYCPTKVQHFRKYFELGDGNDSDSGKSNTADRCRDITNQVCKYSVYCVTLHPAFYRLSSIGSRRCIKI